jgi:transcriptional regulator with XRE-family HTH domain
MMTLKATGAYIVRLRKEAKLSRLALAKLVNTSDSNLMRIEQGIQEAGGMLLALIIRNLNANPVDVINLLLMEDANEEYGTKIADEWIEIRDNKQQRTGIHPDILKLSSQLSDYDLGRWVSTGERFLEESKKPK